MTEYVKRGDAGTLFTDHLTASGVDFNDAASALFLLKHSETGEVVSQTATLANKAIGSCDVSYTAVAADLDTVGPYRQEWQLSLSGSRVLTFPSDSYNEVVILGDLNAP